MKTFEEIRRLYDDGRTKEAMNEIATRLQQHPDDPEKGELLALEAWCHYRRKEYDEAHQDAEAAGDIRFARECLAYLAAYAPGYVSDEKLRAFAQELGDSINVANALVIRARDEGTRLTHGEVADYTLRFWSNDVAVANLWHNAARFFLAKQRRKEDLLIALGFIEGALTRYGRETFWHHRAAATYWKSRILEQLFDEQVAMAAAEDSVKLWEKQVELDPSNASFRNKLDEARKHCEALKA